MRRALPMMLGAYLVALAGTGIMRAGEPASAIEPQLEAQLEAAPSPIMAPVVERTGPPWKRWSGSCWGEPCVAGVPAVRKRPFICDNMRFEPVLRDIRYLQPSSTLPGDDSGIPETLPVLPMRKNGYFITPLVR